MQATFDRSTLNTQKKQRRKSNAVDFSKNNDNSSQKSSNKPRQTSAQLSAIRQSLPIYEYRDALIHAVQTNKNTIVVGETGSGKTTQVPQFLYEAGLIDHDPEVYQSIAITQPRRVAAMTLAQRVSDEIGCELGSTVGYCIRFDDKTTNQTKLKFLTDGMLLREIQVDPLLLRYKIIVLDEAHERTLNTDILFGLLKQLQETKRPDLKIVVMSATLDADKFSQYLHDAPVALIPGRTHHVDVHYLPDDFNDTTDPNDLIVTTVLQIHQEMPLDGDILVFMSGSDEIAAAQEALLQRDKQFYEYWKKYQSSKQTQTTTTDIASSIVPFYPQDDDTVIPEDDNLLLNCSTPPPSLHIVPLYSTLSPDQQLLAFEPAPPNTRKVILSTNIAETSVTISGVKYVVDSGYAKLKEVNAGNGIGSLQNHIISRAEAQQRTGRAGREQAGICYRLYTECAFEEHFAATPTPEIQRTSLISASLQLRSLNVINMAEFPFIDPPPRDAINYATTQLFLFNAIAATGELTKLGRLMCTFPIEPVFARMLIVASRPELLFDINAEQLIPSQDVTTSVQRSLQLADDSSTFVNETTNQQARLPFPPCSEEMCIMIAALTVDSVVIAIPNAPTTQALRYKVALLQQEYYSPSGDLFFYYNILRHFLSLGDPTLRQSWCRQYYFNYKNLSYAMNVYQQLCILLLSCGLPLRSCFDYYIQQLQSSMVKTTSSNGLVALSATQQKQQQLEQRLISQYRKMRYNYAMFLEQVSVSKATASTDLSVENIDPSITKRRYQKIIDTYLHHQRILRADQHELEHSLETARLSNSQHQYRPNTNVVTTPVDPSELLDHSDLSWEHGVAKCLCAGLGDNYTSMNDESHFVEARQSKRVYLHPTSCIDHYIAKERRDFKEMRAQVDKNRSSIAKDKNIINKQAYLKSSTTNNRNGGSIPRTFKEFTSFGHLIFYELLITAKPYMRGVLRIEPDWLDELAHPLVKQKREAQKTELERKIEQNKTVIAGNMQHDVADTGIHNSYFGQRSAHSRLTGNVTASTVSLGSGQQEQDLRRTPLQSKASSSFSQPSAEKRKKTNLASPSPLVQLKPAQNSSSKKLSNVLINPEAIRQAARNPFANKSNHPSNINNRSRPSELQNKPR